jgi:pantoate--beta-alanine ligase
LIRRAAAENDVTALFWGGRSASDWMPSQVGPGRNAERDFALAESAGLDIVFAPESGELFPTEPMTKVSLPAMSSEVPYLESPAHLDLIAMTMGKLWHLFGPCRSYFGEKDWQQLAMFRQLAADLAWPVEVVGCPTIRDERGLALSSRNQQLSEVQRAEASVLYGALVAARRAAVEGTRSTRELSAIFFEIVGSVARIRYFTAVASATMKPLNELTGSVRLLASIEIGAARLVDNIGIEQSE